MDRITSYNVCYTKLLRPVHLAQLRVGVVPGFWANMDEDTRALTEATVRQLESVGVRFVEVPEARLQEMNEAVGFPVVFHEAYDDMVAYLREQGPGISIDRLYAQIASPDVKGIYEAFVLARKTFGPNVV